MDTPTKRDEIIQTAYAVFYKHGFHATGVDRLLDVSRISKRTLYKYFRSKEELIEATVDYYGEVTLAGIARELARRGGDARAKILALFDMRREALETGDFSGCFAISAGLEYAGKHKELEASCTGFLKTLEEFITGLCKEAEYKNPQTVARKIMVLLQGTIIYGQCQHDPAIATAARDVAEMILKSEP